MAPPIIVDIKEIERTLVLLQSHDLQTMGFEAKIAHKRRLERLNQAYADALRSTPSADLPDQTAPIDR